VNWMKMLFERALQLLQVHSHSAVTLGGGCSKSWHLIYNESEGREVVGCVATLAERWGETRGA
jgi:hypothetical protein